MSLNAARVSVTKNCPGGRRNRSAIVSTPRQGLPTTYAAVSSFPVLLLHGRDGEHSLLEYMLSLIRLRELQFFFYPPNIIWKTNSCINIVLVWINKHCCWNYTFIFILPIIIVHQQMHIRFFNTFKSKYKRKKSLIHPQH